VGGWTHMHFDLVYPSQRDRRARVDELGGANRAEETAWPWLGERVSVHHEVCCENVHER
jgi:hypothetical protein